MDKEYIEREAVINRLQTVSMPDDPYSKGIQHGVVHSIAVINEAPAADVVQVVHGRWADRYGGKYDNPKYECSECRKEAPYRPKLSDLFNWYHEQDLSDYCPNCGAKMDGGNDHD